MERRLAAVFPDTANKVVLVVEMVVIEIVWSTSGLA